LIDLKKSSALQTAFLFPRKVLLNTIKKGDSIPFAMWYDKGS